MVPGAAAATGLTCPRCGYDQSGLVATWTDACPLSSPCTECGLALEWRAVHRGSVPIVPWWIEGAGTLRGAVLAVLVAPFVCCGPWWLWSRVSMQQPLRFARLGAAAFAWLAILYLAMAVPAMARVWSVYAGTPLIDRATAALAALTPFGFPLGLAAGAEPSVRWAWSIQWIRTEEARYVLLFAFAAQSIAALAFVALPISRRRAKVKATHLIRAGVAALLTAPLASLGFHGLAAISFELGMGGMSSLWVIGPAILMWHVAWWHATADRYLRMSQPIAIGLSVGAIGVLGAPFAVGLVLVLSRAFSLP